MRTSPVAVGVDIGGTHLKIALVDRTARIVAQQSALTDPARGPQWVVENVIRLAGDLLAAQSTTWNDVVGVGVATPGPLNLGDGRIIKAANLPGWRDVPLRDMIAGAANRPVILENDANAAAFGEFWAKQVGPACEPVATVREHDRLEIRSHSTEVSSLVLLTLGTGVGAGVILDGRILHGALGNAAELGHTIVVPSGLPCPCGQRGCLEQYASAAAVARRADQAIRAGQTSTLSACLSRGEAINSAHVAAAAQDGDTLAGRVWDDACLFLAIAVINIQHAYNPYVVLFGGGMSAAGEFLLVRICDHLDRQKWTLHDDVPELRLAELGNDAGVVGAAGLVWSSLTTLM